MQARKSLGQHFLHSKVALARIVDAADLTPDDIVLEIGPGTGVLTEALLGGAGKVVALEKDTRLIGPLAERFAEEIREGRLLLREADVLAFDPEELRAYGPSYKVVANIPYYITGAIIEKFLTASHQPRQMVLLVQKEVAERVVARDRKESILSLSVKAYGTPRLVAKVGKGSFRPMPKVDSAILSIERISRGAFRNMRAETRFFELLHAGFAHKRKYVRSNLRGLAAEQAFMKASVAEKARAEDLGLEQWFLLVSSSG